MKRIPDHSGTFESDSECVRRFLGDWKPRSLQLSEKEHEQDLQAWLQKCLPEVPIVAQYGIAKGKADLVIEDKHVIELKLAFADDCVAEFDRCIGQMERYLQKWVKKDQGPVYLVVVGKSNSEFRDMLHQAIKHMNGDFVFDRFFLIEKEP